MGSSPSSSSTPYTPVPGKPQPITGPTFGTAPAAQPQNPKKPKFIVPVPPEYANAISQYFGPTNEKLDGPALGYSNFNKGIDWAVPVGTPVVSASEGVVIAVGDQNDGWGISVKVRLPDGRIVNYGHLSEAHVRVGQTVSPGTPIGKSGNSGKSTGPHLSFDILDPSGNPVDPSEYFGVNLARDNRVSSGSGAGAGPLVAPQVSKKQRDQLVSQRDYLMQLRDALLQQDPGGSAAAIAEITKLIIDLDQAIWEIDTYGYPGYQTWAKDAITSKINLGDFELRKAGQVFTEWLNKNAAALTAATNQLQEAKNWNEMVAQSQKDFAFNRARLPVVLQVPPSFEEAYARWKRELGVGEPPRLSEAVNVDASSLGPAGPPVGVNGPFGSDSQNIPSAQPHVPDFSVEPGPVYGTQTFAPGLSKTHAGKDDIWNKVLYGATLASYAPGNPMNIVALPLTVASIAESQGFDVTGMAGSVAKKTGSWLGQAWDVMGSVANQTKENIQSRKVTKPLADNSKLFEYVGPTRTMSDGRKWYWNGRRYVPPESISGDGWMGRVPRSYAQGGKNIPGGPIIVGEEGPEHIVTPDGQVVPVGQQGPQTAIVPDGVDVLPANVPPEQAYLYAKLKQMMQEDLATRDARRMAEAERRRNDPNFEQNFREAVARAAAAILAANPPPTPQLVGEGWTFDPFYYERQLTGVGPDGLPLAQSQMQLPPDPRRQARMDELQQMMQGASP